MMAPRLARRSLLKAAGGLALGLGAGRAGATPARRTFDFTNPDDALVAAMKCKAWTGEYIDPQTLYTLEREPAA